MQERGKRARRTAEAEVARKLRPRLRHELDALRAAESLTRSLCMRLSESDEGDAAARATAILLSRVANDLRGCALLVPAGYATQAMALGAGAIEMVATAAWTTSSGERAERWLRWSQLGTSPWLDRDPADTGSRAEILELLERAAKKRGHKQSFTRFAYSLCCLYKHGNPRLESLTAAAASAEAHVVALDPVVDPKLLQRTRGSLLILLSGLADAFRALADHLPLAPSEAAALSSLDL